MSTRIRLAGVVVLGLVLAGIGVAPQLQARLFGEEYVVRVAPVDPIDPFRGAYVELMYPDLVQALEPEDDGGPDGLRGSGDVFVTLVREGDVWVGESWSRTRPDAGPYLACTDRDWALRCGIESWFLPQDDARALEERIGSGTARATIRVDSRGHAAVIGIR